MAAANLEATKATDALAANRAGGDADPQDFIRTIVADDVQAGVYGGRVVTRFPPEPNGFLHIGHAKAICLNFGVAEEFGGVCNLRMDDTNPQTEEMAYVEAIRRDVRWLGFNTSDRVFFASDYYEQLYQFAVRLVKDGKAYVDSLNEEEIRAYRGSVTEPGRPSPYRERSIADNLDLLAAMRAGEFPDGAHVLRAKIDMASPNMKLRDPLLYRIRHASHYRTGDAWCIYPMYDFAHPLSDAIEGITHSFCTLEFENNRDIYNWLVDNLTPAPQPRQYEFARLFLDYTVMSKRKLLQLVGEGIVSGWDDPRMPTLAGMRRRGVTPEAIRAFSQAVGVARANSRVDIALLDYHIRDDLNYRAPRVLCVLRPLKVVITNYPAHQTEELDASYWPRDVPKEGSRPVPFARELYIEADDFMEEPPSTFYRLAPGREVRLRYAYVIKCDEVVKDPASGAIVELRCTYDPATRGGNAPKGRKVQGTIHWVAAEQALPVEVRLYDRLCTVPNPDEVEDGKTFKDYVNPNSVEIVRDARIEPSVAADLPGSRYQFERLGYFVSDIVDSRPGRLVYNRIIELRDSWAKTAQPGGDTAQAPAAIAKPTQSVKEGKAEPDAKRARTETRASIRAATPELAARLARYTTELALSFEEADVLTGDLGIAAFFEAALAVHTNAKSVANWVTNEVLRAAKERPLDQLPFGGQQLGALVALVDGGAISATAGKEVFAELLAHGGDPAAIVEQRGLQQIADVAYLDAAVEQVIAANPDKAEQVRAGKVGLLGFFVGQVMRVTGGKANPQTVQELVKQKLA